MESLPLLLQRPIVTALLLGLLVPSIGPARPAAAEDPGTPSEVGTVAGIDGEATVVRGNERILARIGLAVQVGDELQTGRPGRLRIVFQDDSVLSLGEDSSVVVEESLFEPTKGTVRSLFELLRGKVNSAVSEYYRQSDASFEIRTQTAVAGVRGTEFTIAYDPTTSTTEVVGIAGMVRVISLYDPEGPGVLVTANEATVVPRFELPSEPRRLQSRLFRDHITQFDFIGRGQPESLSSLQALAAGREIIALSADATMSAPPGMALGGKAEVQATGEEGDATGLLGQPPSVIRLTGQLGVDLGR